MDLRIEKTYRALLTAFTHLLETHRYEEITVAMLCNEAVIRRTTFYRHFADKSEFFAFFVDNLRLELLKHGEESVDDELARLSCPQDPTVDEEGVAILQGMVSFMLEHETLVDNIFESSMSGMLMLMMVDKVAETIRERYRNVYRIEGGELPTLASASEFAAGGLVRLLEKWWVSGHSKQGEAELTLTANRLVWRVLGV